MEFGFDVHKDLLIDQDQAGQAYHDIVDHVPSVALCISCGACGGTCVSAEKTGTGFRSLLVFLRNDLRADLIRGLKYCQFCGKCLLVCPRGVNTRKAIMEMKKYFEIMKT